MFDFLADPMVIGLLVLHGVTGAVLAGLVNGGRPHWLLRILLGFVGATAASYAFVMAGIETGIPPLVMDSIVAIVGGFLLSFLVGLLFPSKS